MKEMVCSYEEEDTCVSYEEEDTCVSLEVAYCRPHLIAYPLTQKTHSMAVDTLKRFL